MNATHTDRLNILLIEDNEDDYVIVRDLLRDIDAGRFALEWAGSYAEGLSAMHAQRHDLILLDFRLSDGTGLELLQETQGLSNRAPVIFMTGQGDHAIDVQVMQAGAADYLVKDRLDADLLERAIRYAVERQKSAEALRASEDRYRTFVENSMEGIWRFELEQPMRTDLAEEEQIAHLGRHAYVAECNEAMARIYGYDHASDIIGARFGEFLSTSEASDDNFLRRLIHNGYRLVSAETFVSDRHEQPKYVLHNLIGVVEKGLLSRIWGSQVDITEHKRGELAQAQIAAIVESSDDAIYSKTLDGLIVIWNKGSEALYGYTAQEVTGQSVSLLSPLHAPEEMNAILARIGRGERVPQFETVHCHKDGSLINISLAVSPIIHDDGHVTGASAIARDISEQKRTGTRLRQSEASMAAAQRIAHFGSWVIELGNQADINANPLLWSDETFRIFGYEPGSVPVTNELFFRAVPPEDQPAIQQAVAAAVAQRQEYSLIHRVRRPDGEERIVRETGQFLAEEATGQSPRLVGTVHDITEQQRAEEQLRFNALLLSQVRNAVVATDLAGQIIYWNSFAETLYQWKSEEVIGRNVAEVTSASENQTAAEQVMREIRETGNWQGEWIAKRKDGSTFPAYVVDTLFHDTYGVVAGIVGVSIDITESKQAEQALREGEREQRELAAQLETERAKLAAAQAVAKVGSWETDLSTLAVNWSAETYRIFEVAPGQCSPTHQDFLQRVHPEDQAAVGEAFVQSLEQSGTCAIKHRLLLPDGRIKFVEERWQVFKDDAGKPVRALGTCQDITESHLIVDALRQSEYQFRRIVETTNEGVMQGDADGKITYVNQRYCDMLGYTAEELLGCSPFDLMDEESRILAQRSFEQRRQGVTEQLDRRFRHKDGSFVWGIVSASPLFDEDGRMIGSFSMTTDITGRKRAEEERDRFFTLSLDMMCMAGLDGYLKRVNPAWQKTLGFSEEELLAVPVLDFVHPDDQEATLLSRKILSQGGLTPNFENRYRCRDGSYRWLQWNVVLDNEKGLLYGVAHDVTDRKRADDALREAEQEQRQLALRLEAERARLTEAQAIAKVGSWELDLLDNVLTWSDETHRIFESDPATFNHSYEAFVENVHPDDRAAMNKAYTESVANRTPYEVDHRIQNQDGSVTFVHERGQTLYDDDGTPIRSVGTVQEITERKQAEEALRESEQKFRSIVETTLEGVLTDSTDSKITYVNERFCEMFGYDANELVGRERFFLVDDEDREEALRGVEHRRQGIREQFDRRFRHKNGSLIWGTVSSTPIFDKEGQVTGSFLTITDITERKRAEEARDRFIAVLEETPDFVGMTDPQGRNLYLNRAARRMIGIDEVADVPELAITQCHPNNLAQKIIAEGIPTAVLDGVWTGETAILHRDGHETPISQVIIAHKDATGKVQFFSTVGRDITERKRAEAYLQRSLSVLRAQQEASLDGILVVDENRRIISMNRRLREMWLLPDEIVQAGDDERQLKYILSLVESKDTFLARVMYLYEHPNEQSHDEVIMTDGRILDRDSGPIVSPEGDHFGRVWFFRDVTERKQSEKTLALQDQAMQASSNGIIVTDFRDAGMPIVYVNPAVGRMTGYSANEMLGRNCRFLQGTDRDQPELDSVRAALRAGLSVGATLRNYRKDGTLFWNELFLSPIYDAEGTLTHYVGIQNDVTDRKQAEAALHHANDELELRVLERTEQIEISHREMSIAKEEAERANAAKSDFLSRMSHELRTPMNSIMGFAQIMEMDAPSDKQAVRLGHIMRAGQHLLQLINEVLDLARVESGRLQLSLEPVSLATCLQSAVDMIRPLCEQRDQQIICDFGAWEPLYVRADQQRLSQVLINLLSNATKYNRDGGVILVNCEQSREGWQQISISDSGAGIPAEHMAKLFQPFERLGADGSLIEGTGLGLALSKRLVELMGGTISVESVVGSGSTFVIELPRAQRPGQKIETLSSHLALPDDDDRRYTILYVEDNLANLHLIEHVLSSHPQYQLQSAMGGLSGLDMARELTPSLILLDLHLPDLPGDEVLARLQADPFTRDIPVVIVSADATSGQIRRLLAAGAADYLTKPLDVRLFNDVLLKILQPKEEKHD